MSVQSLAFDTNLFGFAVGRIDLSENVTAETVRTELQAAHSKHGMKLVYLLAPVCSRDPGQPASAPLHCSPVPGVKVDIKTTYTAKLSSFDKGRLVTLAYMSARTRVIPYKLPPLAADDAGRSEVDEVPPVLRELAIASGEWSRFRIDTGIPRHVFEKMFEAWIRNSLNRSIADEVFVAVDVESGSEVLGFITVKLRQNVNDADDVNIGLLSVSSTHRRMGIASMLLARATLWALEQIGGGPRASHGFMSVVTQGGNLGACRTYESFGFQLATTQDVYHAWLPQHLFEPGSLVADMARIPFCRQHLTGNEVKYATQVIEGGGLDSAGRFTFLCSERLQSILGSNTEKVLIVPSGTAALEMAALLCDIKPGDEVILPSYTFSSTANAFVLRGASLVFVDIRPDTLCINEALIEAAITSKTRAICCVHYAGIPCEMDTILNIAARYDLLVVEDAAQGLMSEYKGRALGSIGHFGCFSFHFTKNVICGEGGAIAVNKQHPRSMASLAAKSLVVWEKGTNRYDFMAGKIDKYEWIDAGSSFVPNEIACAVLWAQLEKCEEITSGRLRNFERYEKGFESAEGLAARITFPRIPAHCKNNAHIFFIVLENRELRVKVSEALKKMGISAMSHYVPLHSAPAGHKYGRIGEGSQGMSVTNSVFDGLIRLPIWLGIAAEEIETVVQCVIDAVRV
jgi:dTDP-4-amino-4,6-dideoxygalactose transaminase